MVLGTDNQEKEPPPQPPLPREGSPPTPQKRLELPTAPELPGASSLYPKVPPYLGATPPQKPTQAGPLVETGGEFRPAKTHKPFSLLELRQIQ